MSGLNIKDKETCELVRKLAGLKGESMTTAVKTSVVERLQRSRPEAKEDLATWLDEVTRYTAQVMKNGPPSEKIGDLLYDEETGLPL